MREKWSAMTPYRQVMLVATVGAMLLATVFYLIVGSQKGVEYGSDFYELAIVDDTRTYTANAHEWHEGNTIIQSSGGRRIVYTVTPVLNSGFMVTCQMGDETYGPYQVAILDLADLPTRILNFSPLDGAMEITNVTTGELLFRGGYIRSSDGYAFLLDENAEHTGRGGIFDYYAPSSLEPGPSVDDLYHFTLGAEESMTGRVDWMYFALALLVAVLNAVSILYAEELFTWSMSFRVAEPEKAKPSEWALFNRQVSWAVCLIFEVIFFFVAILSHT